MAFTSTLLLLLVCFASVSMTEGRDDTQGTNLERLKDVVKERRGRPSTGRLLGEADDDPFPAWKRVKETGAAIRDRFDLGSTAPMTNEGQVAFFKDVLKNGLDPFDALVSAVNSKPMKALLDDTEMQHRIMEHYPILAAFNGFKQATGRRLEAVETKAGFVEGVKNMLIFFNEAVVKLKDPKVTGEAMVKLATSSDPDIQDLFARARAGDKDAVDSIGDLVNLELFPDVDPRALRAVASNMGPNKLLSMPEVMRFIDEDPHMSRFIRNPPDVSAFRRAEQNQPPL